MSSAARMGWRFTGLAWTPMIVWVGSMFAAATVGAQGMIVNEYNAVRQSAWVTASMNATDPGQYISTPFREDDGFALQLDPVDGRIQGNGGNWWELVVTEDHLDARGWALRWANTDPSANRADGVTDPWFGDPAVEQGIVTLTNEPVWADLRSGTIITLSTESSIPIDTDPDMVGNRSFTQAPLPGAPEVALDLSTDTSFDPIHGDWHIHVSASDELVSGSPLVSTVHNRTDQSAGFFAAGRRDFQLTVVDDQGTTRAGPVGEAIAGFASLTDGTGKGLLDGEQVAKLEADPTDGVGNLFFQDGGRSTFGLPNRWSGGMQQDFSALRGVIALPVLPALAVCVLVGVLVSLGWAGLRGRSVAPSRRPE